jgi:cbb3-type cytochrome oxidase subunit 1
MSNVPHPELASVELDEFQYDNRIVRDFAIATILFGLIGMLVGLLAAMQLVFPNLNFDLPFLTFSRIRPLHTNAVIFAFVGNGFFTGLYYCGRPSGALSSAGSISGRGRPLSWARLFRCLWVSPLRKNMPSWNGLSISLSR